MDIFGLLLIFAAVRKGKRMLRAWRTAGAVFAAYRFFFQTPPSTLQADFDDRKRHTNIFHLKV